MEEPESIVMVRQVPTGDSQEGQTRNDYVSGAVRSNGRRPQRQTRPPVSTPHRGDGINQHRFSKEKLERAISASIELDAPMYESSSSSSTGFLASGFAYFQRSREQRRREYLQSQAQEQLQKIAEAERMAKRAAGGGDKNSGGGLQENSTFQQIVRNASSDGSVEQQSDGLKIATPKLSKSGEGISGHIDLSEMVEEDDDLYSIPKVRVEPENNGGNVSPHILTPEQMHQIAIHVLPKTIAFTRWRRLYGLGRDGDSFDSCLRIISKVQRTLMVVRTTKGAVFGGYAESAWQSRELGNAKFYGSAQACLYSIQPGTDKLNVYKWSGKNRYIQLCDTGHKMLAFGGGGIDGAFGLCVEEDFQMGSTGPCDTFDNQPLCDQENFEIVDLEFWEFLTGVF